MFKFKRIYLPTKETQEIELAKHHVAYNYSSFRVPFEDFKRQDFLEFINVLNQKSLQQSDVTGKINWLYIAL